MLLVAAEKQKLHVPVLNKTSLSEVLQCSLYVLDMVYIYLLLFFFRAKPTSSYLSFFLQCHRLCGKTSPHIAVNIINNYF